MLFDLKHIRGDRAQLEKTFPPTAFEPPDEDYRVVAPVHFAMAVVKASADVYRVTGGVTTRLELECGRCLESFALPVQSTFELRYVSDASEQADETAKGNEREVSEDDLTTAFYRDGAMDLLDLMREQFQLVLPMKPLCSDSCRGLCVVCGTNQNTSTCACHPVWEDPRLAALKGLLHRHKEN